MPTLLALHGSGQDETDLIAFARQVAPRCRLLAPRGDFADGAGFTFFRRLGDRSIPTDEVVALAKRWLSTKVSLLPPGDGKLVVGYSSGAIFGEALLAAVPERWAGAVLLRPEPLAEDFIFPPLKDVPILILAGRHDERRKAEDAPILAKQLEAAQAQVTLHVLDAGHGWACGDEDTALTRLGWLASGLAEIPLRPHSGCSSTQYPTVAAPVRLVSENPSRMPRSASTWIDWVEPITAFSATLWPRDSRRATVSG